MKSEEIFELKEGNLKINGHLISFPTPVTKALPIQNLIVARFENNKNYRSDRNVHAFDPHGNCVWQIEASKYGDNVSNSFSNIWISEQGDLIALDWNGIQFKVNLNDGTLCEIIAFNRF